MANQIRPLGVTLIAIWYGISLFLTSLGMAFQRHPLPTLIGWLLGIAMIWGLFAMTPWGRILAICLTFLSAIVNYMGLMRGTSGGPFWFVSISIGSISVGGNFIWLFVQATIIYYLLRPEIAAKFGRPT